MINGEIEKIKSILSITEVLSEYIKLEKAGISLKARCPFHNEKTPSFYVSPDKGIYKCFGCGKSGDIFSFVEEYEGVDFKDALKKLAAKAGVSLNNYKKKDSDEDILKRNLKEIHLQTTFFWQKELYKNKKALEYLKKRGINKETLIKFKIGFAPDEWNKTHNYLLEKKFSEKDILLAGITKKNEKGNIYDRFRNRIIFPLFESSDKTVAFSGRDFSGKDNVAKYLNSPATIIFDKSKELYGFNFAKSNIRKQNYVIVTEGQFDIVLSHQNNFINTVATSGTSLTKKHLQKIKNFSSNIIFAFDSDKAGITSAFRGTKLAIANGFTIKIAKIDIDKDPADILSSENGIKKWAKIISSADDFLVFFSEKIINSKKSFEEKVKKMEDDILPLIAEIKDSIIAEKYLRNIAKGFGVSEKSVILAMEKVLKNNNIEGGKIKKYKQNNDTYLKNNQAINEFPDYQESIDNENIEENIGNYYEEFYQNNNNYKIKLENKHKSTIILNNTKSKILDRIAKIYFLLENQEKIDEKNKNIERGYIKKRFLEFLPEEKFDDFINERREKIQIQNWEFEDILIEENFLKIEVEQLFVDFEKIKTKEKIKELQKDLLKFDFLNDQEKIKEIKKEIVELITKLK